MKMKSRTSPVTLFGLVTIATFSLLLTACGGGGGGSKPKPPPPKPQVSAKNSTITVAPTTVTANGKAQANITVHLKDTQGNPFTGIADPTIKYDFDGGSCTLEQAYQSGDDKATGSLSCSTVGDAMLSFTINGTASPNTVVVHFVAGQPSANNSTITLEAPATSAQAHAVANAGDPSGIADGVTPLIATVTLYDRAGNRVTKSDASVAIASSVANVGPTVNNGDGTYTAQVTTMVAQPVSVDFTLNGKTATHTAVGQFAAPAPASASAYMAPWTTLVCAKDGTCAAHGIYLANAADPSAPATLAVAGRLMSAPVPASGDASIAVAVQGASYDPTTGIVTALGPERLIYARNNALWSLDLRSAKPAPRRFSTLAPAVVCAIGSLPASNEMAEGAIGSGPFGVPAIIVVAGFDGKGKSAKDCDSGEPKYWLLPASADASTQPVPATDAGTPIGDALVDPRTGHFEGFLAYDGEDLVLYSPNLDTHRVLGAGIIPKDGSVIALGRGFHKMATVDVVTASGQGKAAKRQDTLYRVDKNSATKLATLSVSPDNPYWKACNADIADYQPDFARDETGNLYFAYPAGAGFTLYKLAPGADAPKAIYQETADWCNRSSAEQLQATHGRIEFSEAVSTGYADTRLVSVNANGPASQKPNVLFSNSDGSAYIQGVALLSPVADTLWIWTVDLTQTPEVRSIVAISLNGGLALQRVFKDARLAGHPIGGFFAGSGNRLIKNVGIASPISKDCAGAGSWTLYDSATLAAVAKPDFGTGSCANSATFEGFDGFLLGQIGDASGSGVSAVGLFGAAGPLVKLRHYALPKGARQIIVAPLY